MQPDFSQTIKISKKMLHAFFIDRDMDTIIAHLSHEHVSWFGAGYDQMLINRKEIICFFKSQAPFRLPFRIANEDYKLAAVSADSCIVTALLLFQPTTKTGLSYDMELRFSFCFHWQRGCFYVVHVHGSMPGEKPLKNNSFLPIIDKLERAPLQLDLRRMYQIIQTLMDTLPIGIKIMEDLPEYPCAYINKNLLKFLGYDYHTFLSTTNGSGLSIVCAADRKNFLNDLAVCFDSGMEYSTEYHAIKRDGSLLRVLEWGKKVKNSNGIDIINSVLVPLPSNEEAADESTIPQRQPETVPAPIPIHLFLDTSLEILNNTPDAQVAICNVLEFTAKTLQTGRAYIALFQPKTSNLHVLWQWNAPEVPPLTCKLPLPKERVLQHFNTEEICICDSIAMMTNLPIQSCADQFSIHASLHCLLRKNDEKIGLLCIQDTAHTHPWTQNEIDLIQSCAKLLVNPVVHAAPHKEATHIAKNSLD